jgi:hypothetical protein
MIKNIYSRSIRAQKNVDPYRSRNKMPFSTKCIDCGAVFLRGRWISGLTTDRPALHISICSACRRKRDNMPAGRIDIKGDFYREHRGEINRMIRHIEKKEFQGHPLERIMSRDDSRDELYLTTTGVHLARRIGGGLHRSYKGALSLSSGPGDDTIRVDWIR